MTANSNPYREHRNVCMHVYIYTCVFISACQHKTMKKPTDLSPDLWCSRCWAAGSIAFLGEDRFEFLILQP